MPGQVPCAPCSRKRQRLRKVEEVRLRVVEGGVDLVRRLLLVQGPLARVLDAQRRGDDQHLRAGSGDPRRRAACARCAGPPAGARAAGPAAVGSPSRIEGRQLLQGAVAVRHQAPVGRVEEGEGLDGPEPQQLHLQDDGRQVGAAGSRAR